ncbi:uncharacterized protein BO80DRAFT_463545 [Aspergillus ibericus CBS 121593]|uniref:Retrotransposon gag domain-containing protein n=1 Tax=Aspergillus ibericus CBS 121593 TaxID=1448316 RepID=A0A395H5X2_9EURO|nr:hypothetical protein BO80DRAFT_463545 [Aspergillus ibericus CBS 121593]RAL02318.1 hypothetical protein BO80DRAFT_463545 [Aspergillus ibericus CBS 121593]
MTENPLPLALIDVLEGPEHMIPWMNQVKAELQRLGLLVLVEPKIPAPEPHEEGYEYWKHLAGCVLNWLRSRVSHEIRNSPRWGCYNIRSPVEYLNAVEVIVRITDAHSAREKWEKALGFQRNEYNSVREYVTELKRAIMASDLVGMYVAPFQATCILLRWVEDLGEEGRQFSDRICSTLPLNIARMMTTEHFIDICNQAIGLDAQCPTADEALERSVQNPIAE